jgi:hypothetical protein
MAASRAAMTLFASNVMPTEVGTQTAIHIRYVDVWLDPGLRRDDGCWHNPSRHTH